MKNDIVRYNGSAWVMSVDNYTDDVNPEDSNEWKILCEKGEKGDRGSDGDSGLDELLTALGVLTIGGILIPMSLATLLSRINAIPDIENDIDDLQNDVNNDDNRISELERITKYQDSLNNINQTIFNSDIIIKNNNVNKIILEQSTGNISGSNLNCNGDITLGGITKTINLNGFVYVNGFPLIDVGGFFQQW
jgi:hypothetical protein